MKNYPILRLTLFLVAGIFFAETFPNFCPIQILGIILLVFILVLGMLLMKMSFPKSWMFGTGASCIMFLIGWILVIHERQEVKTDWPLERKTYMGIIQESPIVKPKTIQCCVEVNDKRILLYLWKDSLSATLNIGDRLWFYSQIESPRNNGNPYEFDYAGYLLHKGISGISYAHSEYWNLSERKPSLTLKQKALAIREKVIDKYKEWGAEEDVLPILSALTVGYKAELDEEVRKIYSIAGISHVLALSGMHIGIIWMFLNFLLKPMGNNKKLRWLKWSLSTALLWCFAFIAGLEASVVRAVVMCMLMEMAKAAGAKPLSMNTLSIAALTMLLYHPLYLYDVGFQLSFVAVTSILLIYPLFVPRLSSLSGWQRSVGNVLAISVSAQLGTAPLVMYYFSNFSAYFLLANLVAAFLVPLIIYISAIVVLVAPFSLLPYWGMYVLNKMIDGLTGMVRWISEWPYATFSINRLFIFEVILFYVVLGIGLIYWKQRRRIWLIRGLCLVAGVLTIRLFTIYPHDQKAELVFYNVRNCPALHLIEPDGTSFLVTTKKDSALYYLRNVANTFWRAEEIKSPVVIEKTDEHRRWNYQENILIWHEKRIGVMTDNRWKDKKTDKLLNLDYLFLCKDFNLKLVELQSLFQFRTVILDSSLGKYRIERFKKDCLSQGIDFIDLSQEGSLRIFL